MNVPNLIIRKTNFTVRPLQNKKDQALLCINTLSMRFCFSDFDSDPSVHIHTVEEGTFVLHITCFLLVLICVMQVVATLSSYFTIQTAVNR